jgi:hypothetical protein
MVDQISRKPKCSDFTDPTDEQILAHEAEMVNRENQIVALLPLMRRIKTEHNESWKGSEPCPVCGGLLLLSLACHFSGHQGTKKHTPASCSGRAGASGWME